VKVNGFQDRRIRPLCQLSFEAAKLHFFSFFDVRPEKLFARTLKFFNP